MNPVVSVMSSGYANFIVSINRSMAKMYSEHRTLMQSFLILDWQGLVQRAIKLTSQPGLWAHMVMLLPSTS